VTDQPLVAGCPRPPAEHYDVALLDLDGVVYVGPDAVPGVPGALSAAAAAGMRVAFVTNNAARTPDEVAAHLTRLGVPAATGDVITSSQVAAAVVAASWPAGSKVLPVGGPGVTAALEAAGLTVVDGAEDRPVAVVQGYGPQVGWAALAEAVVAVRNGARHIATNGDATIPSPRGPLPGNGALVGVVAAVTGQSPMITGKPDPAMHAECVRRTGARRPLVVGDRLDTDIEGARRAGAASLLVLSGVTDPATLLGAGPQQRPDLLAPDAAGLLVPHPVVQAGEGGARCGSWTVREREGGQVLVLEQEITGEKDRVPDNQVFEDSDGLDGLRALCVAHWSRYPDAAAPAQVAAVGARASEAVRDWGLSSEQ
jgi:HAD superfamily hydrolase (TIGR01450 family)